jgi:glycosyltransferase involved in cell wall biosynthesis
MDVQLSHTKAEGRSVRSNGHDGSWVIAIIPAYNEARFIGSVVLRARQYADQVIVVDDGSTDATAELAETVGALVVRHSENRGKGQALNTGLKRACDLGADIVVTFDADGQHLPEELMRVIAPICSCEADLVVGSRYLQANGMVPRHRIWGHRFFNLLTNLISGVSVTDSQSGFRAFSRAAATVLAFSANGFAVESEMQLLARTYGLRIAEVPITIRYDDKPKRPVWQHGLLVLNGILQLVGQYRPLLFFGTAGSLLMLVGAGWGVHVVGIFQGSGQLAVGYALLSIILFLIGTISFSTGVVLHSVRGLLVDYLKPLRGSS